MEKINPALSTSTLTRINKPFLLGMLLFSFVGVYLGFYVRAIHQLTIITLTGAVFVLYAEALFNDPKIKTSSIAMLLISSLCIVIGVLYNRSFQSAYIFLFFICLLQCYFDKNPISEKNLVDITNYSYLIYVILSILVNLHIIPIGRTANTHDETFLNFQVKSFVGFFGSTAHIDSYSIIVLLVNYYINEGKSRKYFAVLAGFIALITFRTTPILVLFGSIVAIYVLDKIKWKILKESVLIIIFLSFLLPFAVYYLTHDRFYLILLDYLLTGRASLWTDIVLVYEKKAFLNQLIGFGSVEGFTVYTWGFDKSNPHNVFLNFLILYGIIFFAPFYLYVSRKFHIMTYEKKIIFLAILLGGVGNSAVIGFSNLPITIWFTYLLSHEKS